MSTAASPASLPRTPSSARRQQAALYSPTAAGKGTTTVATTPRRSLSTQTPPSSHPRSAAGAPAQALSNVARHDFEQSNLARIPTSSSRSESRDPPAFPVRTDSTRRDQSSRQPHSRQYSDAPAPARAPSMTNGSTADAMSKTSAGQGPRRRTTLDATTGHWELGKTIGAGSMGKVKLAKNKDTHEQVAVKIVPRLSTDEHRTIQERERADHSKEVRTAREAAIVTLVDHPYICGMRDVVRTNYHWYMLFEYVNGGQMLDYIISHGRLKEKQARKFGRQIASALDYCHRNSIVHRDLKIENILISKTGDIKIIDFGLSNTFAPKSHLKTFCGSLYFAAPELLQAKAYTGPEVDVWSFGIVLYVLVCGKVPFDDQSMPQLHAKIKKGFVEYPPWLTAECKNLIGRMLVTDPLQRASLCEIMNHPWMTKGFGGPPENFVPPRKPLQLPLDQDVVKKMDGFDFGAADGIDAQLTKIIESEDYQRAVKNMERRTIVATPEIERKRGVFDFYKRRNSTSRDTLTTSSSEALQLGTDPVNAFSPLISIYYLAKEKIEREQREVNPGALSIPRSPGEKPLKLPDLPAPQAAYTNPSTYEMAGEKPTGGRSRPRARTQGSDEAADGMQDLRIHDPIGQPSPTIVLPPMEQTPTKRENPAVGLLRRFSTRRQKEPVNERIAPPPSVAVSRPVDTNTATAPAPNTVPRKSFSMRRTRDREADSSRLNQFDGAQPRAELLTPPPASGTAARFIGLGRSTSVNSGDFRQRLGRRGVSEGASLRPPLTPRESERAEQPRDTPGGDAASDAEMEAPRTVPASRTKSLGHARRESIQARRARRADVQTSNVPEETDAEMAMQEDADASNTSTGGGSPGMKPVYLKGLFSVSTTSSKSLSIIRGDIIRVLRQLGVEYSEIKGGFRCKHAPSIDLKKTADEPAQSQLQAGAASSGHRRKISFGALIGGDRDRDEVREQQRQQQQQQQPTTPGSSRSRQQSRSYTDSDNSDEDVRSVERPGVLGERKLSSPATTATTGSRVAGETSTHVQTDLGQSMVLRFEIFVVKVPLLSLHGIQFKKVDGGTWQYKTMAQTILNELRL